MSAWQDYNRQMAEIQQHRERTQLRSALFDQQMAALKRHMEAMEREANLFYQEHTAAIADGRELTPDTYSVDLQRAVAATEATYSTYLDARRAYESALDPPEEVEPEASEPLDSWDEDRRRGEVWRINVAANELYLLRFQNIAATPEQEAAIHTAIQALDQLAGPKLAVGKALHIPTSNGDEVIYLIDFVNDDRVHCHKILIGDAIGQPSAVLEPDGWMSRTIAEEIMLRSRDRTRDEKDE